jgi:hypothetical protein
MPESDSQGGSRIPTQQTSILNLPHRFSKTAGLESLLLCVLLALFVWRAFIPAWSSLNTDFPNYYLTARLYRQGYPMDRVYDWIWFQRQWDHTGFERRLVAYIPLTLFSALPVLPLCSLPPLQAKRGWLVINLVLLGLAAYLLSRITKLGWRRILILTFLATFPLRTNFLFGQQHLLVFFLLTLAAWFYFSQRPASSGAILALAAALKLYPALLVFYFLRKRQWRALTGLVLTGLGLAGLSLLLFGMEAHRVYLVEVLPRVTRGEGLDPYNVHWQSLTALLHRLFISEPELNPQPLLHLPAVYAVLQPLCQALLLVSFLWLMSDAPRAPGREKLEYGSYVALLLILSPNPASYHFCALILTAVLATDYLLARGLRTHAGALVTLYGLASLSHARWMMTSPTGWSNFLAFPRLYALLAFALFLLWTLAGSSSPSLASRLRTREGVVFTLVFVGIVATGTWSNLRHLKGQFANYGARLAVTPGSQMEIHPTISADKVVFTTLNRERYGVSMLAAGALSQFDFGVDAFHPALVPGLPEAWVELASIRSRIVRFPLSGPLPPANQLPVEVEDGEQPVVSPDGRWLLFIREQQGRGSLWIKDLRPEETTVPSKVERRLAGDEFNVLDATFSPDSRGVLFSAQRETQPEPFSVSVVGNPRVVAAKPQSDWPATRYPAFSPDGAWLAFSWYQRGTWQLCLTKMGSGTVRQLTHGDCNSITPAWLPDSQTIVYATDCGRGLGMTALASTPVIPGGQTEESKQPH